MTDSLFHYMSPLIFPVLGGEGWKTEISFNFNRLVEEDAFEPADADLECRLELYSEGELKEEEVIPVRIRDGRPDLADFARSWGDLPAHGYAQFIIAADRPYFRKILTEQGYIFAIRPDGGAITIDSAYKYSLPLISEQLRRIGRFCLVHPAQYVSESRDIGNSVLIVNPFDGKIVATLETATGERLRRRIEPRTAVTIPLQELIPDGRQTTVMYTGSNRYPAWDVRHAWNDPALIHRIDHLEYYRAIPNIRPVGVVGLGRALARRWLRRAGLRYD